jgi:hypothetical protein
MREGDLGAGGGLEKEAFYGKKRALGKREGWGHENDGWVSLSVRSIAPVKARNEVPWGGRKFVVF